MPEQFAAPADKRNGILVNTLQREVQQLQADHAQLLASVAQGQYRFAAPAALAASLAGPVRAALGPSRVLVEYLVAADRTYAFVVSGTDVKVEPLEIGRDALRQRVQRLLQPFCQLRTGELDLTRPPYETRAAYDLYQAVSAAVRPALGPVLHAQFAGEKYLLHRYAISSLSSSAQLLARAADTAAPRPTPKRFFALANPAAGRATPAPAAGVRLPTRAE